MAISSKDNEDDHNSDSRSSRFAAWRWWLLRSWPLLVSKHRQIADQSDRLTFDKRVSAAPAVFGCAASPI
jgi:hypothetical protein